MKLWKQAVLILAVFAAAVVVWALYVPAAQPFLAESGALATLERMGLVNAAQVARDDDAPARPAGPPVTVVAQPVVERVMNDHVVAIGTAQSVRSVELATEISGRIEVLDVAPGSQVTRGQLIAELSDEAARIALDRAALGLADQRRNFDRLSRLRAAGAVPELQFQEAEVALKSAELAVREAEFELSRHRIAAPIAGWVGIIPVSVGDLVSTGTIITTIEDRSSLLVAFRVPERLAARVRPGDPVTAAALADPGRELLGEISTIDNRVDEASRTLRVQATLPNEDDRLRPGMAVSLTIDLTGDSFPSVDPLAIQWGASGAYVWVLRDGLARQQPVRVVQRNAEDVLVEADFAEGDLVVTEGVMALRPGQPATTVGLVGE